MTREEWLLNAVELMRPYMRQHELEVPAEIHVSVGFPRGSRRAVGQCFYAEMIGTPMSHIFISPTVGDPVEVLGILLHELIHASIGCGKGHGPEFLRAARAVGLAGRATATTVAKGSQLDSVLTSMIGRLGGYPHNSFEPMQTAAATQSKWRRLRSQRDKRYTLVISQKSIERLGRPKDPWGEEMIDVG